MGEITPARSRDAEFSPTGRHLLEDQDAPVAPRGTTGTEKPGRATSDNDGSIGGVSVGWRISVGHICWE